MESVYLGTYIGQLFKVSLLQCAQGRIRNRGRRCCVLVEGHLGRMRNDGGHEQRPCGRNERDVFVGKLKPGCDKCCRKCCTAAKIGPCQKPLEERLEELRWLQSGPQTPSQPGRLDCACWFSSQSAPNQRSATGGPAHGARLCLFCARGLRCFRWLPSSL